MVYDFYFGGNKKCSLLSNRAETKHDDDAEGPFFPHLPKAFSRVGFWQPS
jgi:hypothetical protein